jgi:RING-box protein 1
MEKPDISVEEWNGVALWSWDLLVDTCAICRNLIMEPCIECQSAKTSEVCEPACGACNHAYHLHCITRWLQTRNVCPLDNKRWEFRKYGNCEFKQ